MNTGNHGRYRRKSTAGAGKGDDLRALVGLIQESVTTEGQKIESTLIEPLEQKLREIAADQTNDDAQRATATWGVQYDIDNVHSHAFRARQIVIKATHRDFEMEVEGDIDYVLPKIDSRDLMKFEIYTNNLYSDSPFPRVEVVMQRNERVAVAIRSSSKNFLAQCEGLIPRQLNRNRPWWSFLRLSGFWLVFACLAYFSVSMAFVAHDIKSAFGPMIPIDMWASILAYYGARRVLPALEFYSGDESKTGRPLQIILLDIILPVVLIIFGPLVAAILALH